MATQSVMSMDFQVESGQLRAQPHALGGGSTCAQPQYFTKAVYGHKQSSCSDGRDVMCCLGTVTPYPLLHLVSI